MTVEAFKVEHLREIEVQPIQKPAVSVALSLPEYLDCISANPAVTIRDTSGQILCVGGVVEFEDGSMLWSYISTNAGRNMTSIVRTAKRIVEVAKHPMYATASCGFEPACRLLRLLGFARQRELKGFGTAGGDEILFARN
jgi:hypothetical protein